MNKEPDEIAENLVTIRVRDEAKGGQRDFICDRDLLISEMRYFRSYLMDDANTFVPNVEILVHCDVKVFEWLMRYVKRRKEPKNYQECWLSVSNVLALLISSDFLQMDSLLDKCVAYFCEHINAIIASPCSLSCLTDTLLQRIVKQLDVVELEKMKDKKDKVKSKLFLKKLEQLFDENYSSPECPENAFFIFQCAYCDCILTKTTAQTVPCLPWRRLVSQSGNLIPIHRPLPTRPNALHHTSQGLLRRSHSCYVASSLSGPGAQLDVVQHDEKGVEKSASLSRTPVPVVTGLNNRILSVSSGSLSFGPASEDNRVFSVTELLANWYRELGSWRLVYWRLWATINVQNCSRCFSRFPIIQLGDGCFFHPDKPVPVETYSIPSDKTTQRVTDSRPLSTLTLYTGPKSPHTTSRCTLHPTSAEPYRSGAISKPHGEERLENPVNAELNQIYPCCGLRQFCFEPFEVKSGCYRNQHLLDETSIESDIVTRLAVQHRDLIISWAPKRSFNPNNAPGLTAVGGHKMLSPDADQVRQQSELFATSPAFLLLACFDRPTNNFFPNSSVEQFNLAQVGNQSVMPIHEIPGGHMTAESARSNQEPRKCALSTTGLLSSTFSESSWDSMKCHRTNQDSQRQGDLRRMHRIAEYLHNQRKPFQNTTDVPLVRESASGIYSRLESQWCAQFGVSTMKQNSTQLLRKSKPSGQYVPFR
ncbi:hypothetical protein PHET_04917 [Paragonimus heterotremus]|uniref:SANT and BTB domain-containing protein n=1 Tax=Paragonimus heterotremus TaxID=100268 RepID=A0A8J4SQ56_9TREM|nr:hypothetical protein PHET_04917 [Paragonimus heterotremus]